MTKPTALILVALTVIASGSLLAQAAPTLTELRNDGNITYPESPMFSFERFDPTSPLDLDVRASAHASDLNKIDNMYSSLAIDLTWSFSTSPDEDKPTTFEDMLGMEHIRREGGVNRWSVSAGLRIGTLGSQQDADDPVTDYSLSGSRLGLEFGLAYNVVPGRRYTSDGALTHVGWGFVAFASAAFDFQVQEHEIDPAGAVNEFEWDQELSYFTPRLGMKAIYHFDPYLAIQGSFDVALPLVLAEDLEDEFNVDANSDVESPELQWGGGISMLLSPRWNSQIEFRGGFSVYTIEFVGENEIAWGANVGVRIPF